MRLVTCLWATLYTYARWLWENFWKHDALTWFVMGVAVTITLVLE